MKSFIQKWSKNSKAKGKSSAGGSELGSREAGSRDASSELNNSERGKQTYGSSTPTAYPGMEAEDFGKFSDDSAFRDSICNDMNRPKGNSSSTAGGNSSSSQFSSSIEGKPSMDSVLWPQVKQGQGKVGDSVTSLGKLMKGLHIKSSKVANGNEADQIVPGCTGQRASMESVQSAGAQSVSTTRSRRSSFALERASFDANRSSLELFGNRRNSSASRSSVEFAQSFPHSHSSSQAMAMLCERAGLPEDLRSLYARLMVVPPDTPLPMTMLKRLWNLPAEEKAEATAALFETKGVMRVASLFDGTAWALVTPEHLYALGAAQPMGNQQYHAALLDAYRGSDHTFASVADDGYIMQNVGHHLVGAGRLQDLKQLLASPGWLERKLHSYGTASAVADFRRYLMVSGDEEVKLLLEAFQMSVSACLSHPQMPVLRAQMLGRLMAIQLSPNVKEWLARVDGGSEEAGRHAAAGSPCLFTRTPSLEQAGGLQRMTLRGHTGGISKVLLTPGGIDVITVSADSTARVWDMEIGDCVLLLGGHTGPLTNVAAAADGSLLITTSSDGTARVWELEKGECLHELIGHTAAVNCAAVDAEGRLALTGSADGTGRVWDIASAQCIHILSGHEHSSGHASGVWAVALSPDGRRGITAGEDFSARVWDVLTGRCTAALAGHSGWVVDVAITPCGSRCITASHDGTARLWDIARGKCERVMEGHTGRLNSVRLGPDHTALTVSDDYTARVWDISTGACKHVLKGHGGWLTDGTIDNHGNRAITASGDELAVVWDMVKGSCLNVLEGHSGEVRSVVLTRRGRFAVTGSADCTARVWDLDASSGHAQGTHTGRVSGLVINGDTAISYGNDEAIVWDTAKGRCQAVLRGHDTSMRWAELTAGGRELLTASADGMVKRWDLHTVTCKQTSPGHPGSRVKSFAVSANGRVGVTVLFDSSISVWDLKTMQLQCALQKRGERDASRVHSGGVNAALVSRDGRLAVTLSKDCTARVWDLKTGTCRHVLVGHSDNLEMGTMSADGSMVLTAAYDKSARVWDMASGKCLAVLASSAQVVKCAISPSGRLAATATQDHGIQIWEIPSGRILQDLTGHGDDITGLSFSPDSAIIVSSSRDCSLRVWQVSTGAVDGFFMADTGLTCCEFAGLPSKPMTVVAGSESGVVHFLELPM